MIDNLDAHPPRSELTRIELGQRVLIAMVEECCSLTQRYWIRRRVIEAIGAFA